MPSLIFNLRKWYKMLTGKSILHVQQNIGLHFTKNNVTGYYNDLREKVTKYKDIIDTNELPIVYTDKGEPIYFPVAIFQYGLGAYDLYIETNDSRYLLKFKQCADWALDNQEATGAWNNFYYIYPNNPYGAMCQGEGISLLVRAYLEFKDDRYFSSCEKALKFMLLSNSDGGTAIYQKEDIYLLEYTHLPVVLNGWIFSIFGIWDYVKVSNDEYYKTILNKTLSTLKSKLSNFDNGYWSMYDLSKNIASPFYHNLHIAQMQALFQLTGEAIFDEYAGRWRQQQQNIYFKGKAFVKKSIQKLFAK